MAQAPSGNQGSLMDRASQFFRGNQNNTGDRGTRQNNTQDNQRGNNNQNNNNNNQNQNDNQNNNRQQQQRDNNQNRDDLNNPENRQTPFDAYKGLWDTVDNSADVAPPFKLDDKLINGTAEKLNFLSDLPEDLQTELAEHFGEKMPAIEKLMNHIGRRAYATSLNHTTALTDKYLNVKGSFDQKGLGRSIKEHMALTGLDAHKAAQTHPIVKETLRMIGKQIAQKHPDASPDWIQEQSIKFFTEMHGALNPTPEATQVIEAKKPGGADFDWDGWTKDVNKAT